MNPFAIIVDIATAIVETQEENEELRRKEILQNKQNTETRENLKRRREYEVWKELTDEAFENPEEYMVLPYGWSPFGIYL